MVAEFCEKANCEATNASASTRNKNFSLIWIDSELFKRHDSEHRRVSRCPNCHRVKKGEWLGQSHEPFRPEASQFSKSAPVDLADFPAIHNDLVARSIVVVPALLYNASKIDARNHRETAYDWSFAGQRQRVLVVHRRVDNPDRDVFLGQLTLIELS